eukprot:tig00000514_g1800.t1
MGSAASARREKLENAAKTGVLSLADSGLAKVSKKVVAVAPALRSLDLSGNRIPRLRPELLPALKSLRILDLSRNHLEVLELPADVGPLGKLETLKVDGNRLAALPDLSGLRALRALSASRNRLAALGPCPRPSSPSTSRPTSWRRCRTTWLGCRPSRSSPSPPTPSPPFPLRVPAPAPGPAPRGWNGALSLTAGGGQEWAACRSLRVLVLSGNKLAGPLPGSLLADTPVNRVEADGNPAPARVLLDDAPGFQQYEGRRVARVDKGLAQVQGFGGKWAP